MKGWAVGLFSSSLIEKKKTCMTSNFFDGNNKNFHQNNKPKNINKSTSSNFYPYNIHK